MRKLLILTVVLGMASMANAGLTLLVGGVEQGDAITISPTDSIWIGIDAVAIPNPGQWIAYLSIDDPCSPGAWTGGNNNYVGPEIAAAYNYYMGVNPYYGDTWYANNSDGSPTSIGADGLQADFEFHCEGPGQVLITLVDYGTGLVVDTLTITQIPEPITMALLGLGGLFLRRRK